MPRSDLYDPLCPQPRTLMQTVAEECLSKWYPPLMCKVCGSVKLQPDPAGYYMDAELPNGAPLMCVDYKRHEAALIEEEEAPDD